jgi:tRNA threonylcarbamoyladenosine modification (KEOPS) complex Cgi121 subunit
MIKSLDEYEKILLIEGLLSKVIEYNELRQTLERESPDITIQLLDGNLVLGYDHILFAVLNALKSKRNKKMISEDLPMEILVYASAQRQINKSIEILGVKKNSHRIVLVALSESEKRLYDLLESISKMQELSIDNSLFDMWDKEMAETIKTIFKISNSEFESVKREDIPNKKIFERLIIEKMTLLSIS